MAGKKLIVSYDSYSWVTNCSGLIMKDPKQFEIIIISKDSSKQIYGCHKTLCEDAIYAQRKHDLNNIGRELKIRKLYNLLHEENNPDLVKLSMQLQLNILIGGISKIYYQKIEFLDILFNKIKLKCNSDLFSFDNNYLNKDTSFDEICFLNDEEINKKEKLIDMIIGTSKGEVHIKNPEVFYNMNDWSVS